MKENIDFFFNNALSSDMGLMNVQVDNAGMFEQRLSSEREILEEKITGNSKPYFLGVDKKPFQFEMAFAFLDYFDDEKLRSVSRWLNVSYYREFYFIDNPTFRFFAMPTSDINLIHNGLKQGYLRLTFKTNDAYAYSQEFLTSEYDFSANDIDGTTLTLENTGDLPLAVEMWIRKVGDGNVSITNTSDNNRIFEINNLLDTEEVYINNEREDVISNLPNVYHFDDVTTDFLILPLGTNVLNVIGTCKIQFRYRYKYQIAI